MLEKMMNGYGRELVAVQGEVRTGVRGFLQPVNSRAQRLAKPEMGPLGREYEGAFVYIGPAVPEIRPGDLLEAGSVRYWVRYAQPVWYGDEVLYCWAMCTEEGGEDTWGING